MEEEKNQLPKDDKGTTEEGKATGEETTQTGENQGEGNEGSGQAVGDLKQVPFHKCAPSGCNSAVHNNPAHRHTCDDGCLTVNKPTASFGKQPPEKKIEDVGEKKEWAGGHDMSGMPPQGPGVEDLPTPSE